jgi:hypothetical protein
VNVALTRHGQERAVRFDLLSPEPYRSAQPVKAGATANDLDRYAIAAFTAPAHGQYWTTQSPDRARYGASL